MSEYVHSNGCGSIIIFMSIEQYKEFIELAKCLNFSEAADKLHMTQPALSKHLKALEVEFGGELFSRDRRSVKLTEAGRVLFGAATQIVEAYDRAHEEIQLLTRNRPIRIDGILYDSMLMSMISLTSTILGAEGASPIVYEHKEDANLFLMLERGEVDVILAYQHERVLTEQGLEHFGLVSIPVVAVVDRSNPLATRSMIRMADLKEVSFIQFIDEYSISGWRSIVEACERAGFASKTRPMLGRPETSYATTPPAGGVVLLPNNLPQLKYMGQIGDTVAIPVASEDVKLQIDCIYKTENAERLSRVISAFRRARDIVNGIAATSQGEGDFAQTSQQPGSDQ